MIESPKGSATVMQSPTFDEKRGGELSSKVASLVPRWLSGAWAFLRQVSGDDAYERYREHVLQVHAGEPLMSRSQYYRARTEQKWNRVTRCC